MVLILINSDLRQCKSVHQVHFMQYKCYYTSHYIRLLQTWFNGILYLTKYRSSMPFDWAVPVINKVQFDVHLSHYSRQYRSVTQYHRAIPKFHAVQNEVQLSQQCRTRRFKRRNAEWLQCESHTMKEVYQRSSCKVGVQKGCNNSNRLESIQYRHIPTVLVEQ